jgi:hypothetical protein
VKVTFFVQKRGNPERADDLQRKAASSLAEQTIAADLLGLYRAMTPADGNALMARVAATTSELVQTAEITLVKRGTAWRIADASTDVGSQPLVLSELVKGQHREAVRQIVGAPKLTDAERSRKLGQLVGIALGIGIVVGVMVWRARRKRVA